MHDGSLASLEAVVEFYDRGGKPNPHLDPLIQPAADASRKGPSSSSCASQWRSNFHR
jgi:hypothetical protein